MDSRKALVTVAVTVALILAAQQRSGGQQPTPTEPPTITFQGREIPNTVEEILNPKHTVLVVHELLNDFISVGGASDNRGRRYDADRIIQPVAELLAAARAKNVRVAYVRWTRHADGSTNSDPQRRNNPALSTRPPSNIEGTWGWEAPEAIKPMPGDWVLPKWRQDAFVATQLDALMRWNDIKTMVIVGLGAEVGIVPTVTHAATLGYFAVAVEDCIVPSNPAWEEDAIKFIGRSAMVKNRAEIIEIWNKSAPRPVAPTTPSAAPAPRTAPDLHEVLDPKHTVLLVHEMINAWVTRGGYLDRGGIPRLDRVDADATMPTMARLMETARSKGVQVAYVRWTSYADGSASANVGLRTVLPPPSTSTISTIEGTWGWEIADPVKPAEGDWVLRKYRPDAFYATPLDILMRWNGMKTLVMVGPGTEVGVLPTFMTAANLGYRRVAISDALIAADPARKEDGMRFIGHQSTVMTSDEVLDIWRAATPTPRE
jgi:nicotinamidase-related amidase